MPDGKPSYVGLSVSVSGYPKYRQYKNGDKLLRDKSSSEERDPNTNANITSLSTDTSIQLNRNSNACEDEVFLPSAGGKRTCKLAANGVGARAVSGTTGAVTLVEEKKCDGAVLVNPNVNSSQSNNNQKQTSCAILVVDSTEVKKVGRWKIRRQHVRGRKDGFLFWRNLYVQFFSHYIPC